MTATREASPVEKVIAWLHDVPADFMRAANEQQLQFFADDLEVALSLLNPEYRKRVREQFGLPESFGEHPGADAYTMTRRLGLLRLLGKKVLPQPLGQDFNWRLRMLLGK